MGRDLQFLLGVLEDGEEHELGEILQRSFSERGHGLTVHSRAADLRKHGYSVKNRTQKLPTGRVLSYYRLVRVGGDAERLGPDGVSSSPSRAENSATAGSASFPLRPESAVAGDLAAAPPGGPPEMAGQPSLLDSLKEAYPELFEEAA